MNYKRTRKRFIAKLARSGALSCKCFFLCFGIAGTVVTLISATGTQLSGIWLGSTAAALLLLSVAYGYWLTDASHLCDTIILNKEDEMAYELMVEDEATCRLFNQETAAFFENEYIEDRQVETWRRKCPHGFFYIKNKCDYACAAACIFGLREGFMEQFIKGRLNEGDIEDSDVLPLNESIKSASLYLGAIIVREPNTPVGHRRSLVMIWGVIQYIKRTYGCRKPRRIFAIPVNKASENLVIRFGFRIETPPKHRKDGHPLYVFEITRKSLDEATARIGDYSKICTISIPKREDAVC